MKSNGNTVHITGAGSGIGLALAEEFAQRGNEVIAAARSAKKIRGAAAKEFRTMATDVSDAASVQSLAGKVAAEFPAMNVVIHNAAFCRPENLVKGANAETRAVLRTLTKDSTGLLTWFKNEPPLFHAQTHRNPC
jgi:uncharacterized oxidoreductase